jgi:hypothetical protein
LATDAFVPDRDGQAISTWRAEVIVVIDYETRRHPDRHPLELLV